MPRFDTSFDFGANKPKAPSPRPKPPRKPRAGRARGRARPGAALGS